MKNLFIFVCFIEILIISGCKKSPSNNRKISINKQGNTVIEVETPNIDVGIQPHTKNTGLINLQKYDDFEPGQIWSYKTRQGEEDSRLIILKIESHPDIGEIIHVSP